MLWYSNYKKVSEEVMAFRIQNYVWLQVVEPRIVPSEWLTLDLGAR